MCLQSKRHEQKQSIKNGANIDELVKSHQLDDSLAERSQAVKSSRCKARKSFRMRRTEKYVGLAELSQAMTKDETQHSRWTFYKVVRYYELKSREKSYTKDIQIEEFKN